MINAENIKGVWTALITPFNDDESIDFASYDALVQKQLDAGVTGILVCGTTGESPTITDTETAELIKRTKEKVGNKCLIMVGSGTNSTKKSIEKTKAAYDAGADVVLLVNPYYNKPTQQGLYLHFKTIANSTELPVVLYNIKGRTGVNLETETLVKLIKEVKNIIGVKEASGDIKQIKSVGNQGLENFVVLSGDDGLTFEAIKNCNTKGVISVASNIFPKEVINMVDLALSQNFTEAEKINNKLDIAFKTLFIETNPIPVKYSAYKLGWCKNIYRLPMCPISEKNALIIDGMLKDLNLLK